MEKKSKKIIIIGAIIIAIFSIGIVLKTFQNDTFFYISIGKYILENGIDMQEHFSWVDGLTYTYSHWAFDIVIYLLYQLGGFTAIYIGVILFTIVINVTLFVLLSKRTNSPLVSLLITLISAYFIRGCFTARSQIVSFLCFIIEIYCIEQFIETNKKKYAIGLIILSIVVANFHAATWPLFLVLFLPYLGASFLNLISFKSIYTICAKRSEKKMKKTPTDSPKFEIYKKDFEDYTKLANVDRTPLYSKLVRREHYNTKNLIILMIIVALTGLLTPIHGTPYTYIIKSMFGPTNFENNLSIDYIQEMQPIIPATSIGLMVFIILLAGFLIFLPTKLKTEHGFLIFGLLIMTVSSARYVYLLMFLGSYVLADLLSQGVDLFISNEINKLEEILVKPICYVILIIFTCIISAPRFIDNWNSSFVDEALYPVGAVEYIKNNIDYKNMKIYNSYNNGSYLMLNDIPVFIDSRLDVYCKEFNDTDVFYDYIQISNGTCNYEDVFSKYNFTHILLYNDEITSQYIKNDANYKKLYSDDYFTLYERNVVK